MGGGGDNTRQKGLTDDGSDGGDQIVKTLMH